MPECPRQTVPTLSMIKIGDAIVPLVDGSEHHLGRVS
jgi:hypothetical protein